MRLVDADALPIVARGKNHHRKYVFADITDAPTIDAIPVEWLKKVRDIYLKSYHAGHESELHIAAILNDTLQAWQKEQEAQDG